MRNCAGTDPATPRRCGGRRGRRCTVARRCAAADGAARVPDHRQPALPPDRGAVRDDRPRAGHLRLPRARRRSRPRGRDPGEQSAAAVAAAAAGADRELGGLPQHRHRVCQLAQHPLAALAQSRDRRRISSPPTSTTPSCGMLQDTGAMLDDGMVYWDVRPSANFPTIEVRVADVPATVAETVLLAALVRARCDDGAGGGAARRESRAAGAACAARRVLEVGTRRARRSRDRPDGKPRRCSGRGRCSTASSVTSGPRSRRSATTTWCAPNSPASPNTATARCASDGPGSAGTTSPMCSPRRPRRRWSDVRPAAVRRTPGSSASRTRRRAQR